MMDNLFDRFKRTGLEETLAEMERQRLKGKAIPEHLFRIGREDAVIHCLLSAWKQGDMSWEAMLLHVIVAQQQSVEKYKAELLRALEQKPPTVFLKS